ncbi:hypothetical protein E6C60_0379 [Paenibacillus algicola]|uniref:Small peptidoglycan-associated lipoprotein n=1 Tax=Paenibacillus algicola TaxID=2565926 RepID=A0A4P8XG78_9BACL|nr:hypothetical protein [Paenibacillus algicola]QCT01103.1 hypothetical protein E6C60_0379 [Paenibacillus algicola]
MKKTKFLLILLFFLLTAGCTGSSKDEKIESLYSKSDDTYMIHLFYEYKTQLDEELLSYMNSSDELLKIINGIQVYDVDRKDNQSKIKSLDIDNFPTILVTNNKDIKLTTHDIEEVKLFFDNIVN